MKIFQINTSKQVLSSTNSADADPRCPQMFFQTGASYIENQQYFCFRTSVGAK